MVEAKLREELEQQYRLICFSDLSNVCETHAKIYNFLRSVWRSKYDPDHRLVFYTSHLPSQKILDHVQHGLASVDISNFFVLICCPYDLTESLTLANEKYGYDENRIQFLKYNLHSSASLSGHRIYDHDVLCPMPFIHLQQATAPQITHPCCRYDKILDHEKNASFEEIFNSSQMIELREDMRQGVKHQHCSTCWKSEEQGTISQRQIFLEKFQNKLNNGWVDDIKIRSLTIVPSIVCNFKCRICSATSSTTWAKEELKFAESATDKDKIQSLIDLTKNQDVEDLLSKLESHFDTLEDLHLLGGEPLYYKNFGRILKSIIDQGYHRTMSIYIASNGSVYRQDIVDLMKQFKKAEILLSIDDIGSRFELQRGGSWEDVKKNIARFSKMSDSNFVIKLIVTVNIQNVFYLDQIVNFAQSLNLDIVWTYLKSPEHYNIDNMTADANQLIWTKYRDSDHSELRAIAKRVKKNVPSNGTKFIEHTLRLDLRRNQKFNRDHKEIFEAMLFTSNSVQHSTPDTNTRTSSDN